MQGDLVNVSPQKIVSLLFTFPIKIFGTTNKKNYVLKGLDKKSNSRVENYSEHCKWKVR